MRPSRAVLAATAAALMTTSAAVAGYATPARARPVTQFAALPTAAASAKPPASAKPSARPPVTAVPSRPASPAPAKGRSRPPCPPRLPPRRRSCHHCAR
jgi:hypothetical protein